MEPIVEPIHIPYAMEVNDTSISQDSKPLVISYTINQPVDQHVRVQDSRL